MQLPFITLNFNHKLNVFLLTKSSDLFFHVYKNKTNNKNTEKQPLVTNDTACFHLKVFLKMEIKNPQKRGKNVSFGSTKQKWKH